MLYHSTKEVTGTAGILKAITSCSAVHSNINTISVPGWLSNQCVNTQTCQEDSFTNITPSSTTYTSITTINQCALHTCPREQLKTDSTQTSSPTTTLQAATSIEVTDLLVDHDIMRLFGHRLQSVGGVLGSPRQSAESLRPPGQILRPTRLS